MTTDQELTLALIIATSTSMFIQPYLAAKFASRMNQPKPSPNPDQPKNRSQRIKESVWGFLISSWKLPVIFIFLNLYGLIANIRDHSPLTRLGVLAISGSIGAI